MKSLLLLVVSFCIYTTSFAQDFIYTGVAEREVKSFWINAMGIKKTGKIAEGIAMMEAKMAVVKQKDPAYKINDMEAEIKKWKDKLGAGSSNPVTTSGTATTPVTAPPQNRIDIKDLVISNPPAGYNGPAKTFVNDYYKAASEAKEKITARSFYGAQSKIRQMENALSSIKIKDLNYNSAALDTEISNFKASIETEKYNQIHEREENNNAAQNAGKADELLRQLFESTHIGFSTGDEPIMPIRVQDYKDKTQAYLTLGTKGNVNNLDYMKKLVDAHIVETNQDIVRIDNLVDKGAGTNWAPIAYYTIQYNLAFWDAAQKVYPTETDFVDEYKKTAAFAAKIGSIDNMKAKGGAAELVVIKNRKLPVSNVKDTKLEKVLTDGFNNSFGAKATALKAVLVQNGWTTLRNSISGIVTGRERSAKLAYKSKDGKCYLLEDYIFIREEYIGNSFTNTKAIFNGLFGQEMLCENVK
jgi:hypothetical protein